MSITVIKPGVQSTIQSGPRTGMRHLGVPSGGAADPLSLALANRLVGNAWDTSALEVTLVGPTLRFEKMTSFAIAGGTVNPLLNGVEVRAHETLFANEDDELIIGPVSHGARAYLAVPGGFSADDVLGSTSTNLQAGFGGFQGRALRPGDSLGVSGAEEAILKTPREFRPLMQGGWALRSCVAAESSLLDDDGLARLFDTNWVVARRADRMGLKLDGPPLAVASEGRMPSAGVFPGTIQCPEDGAPYMLSVDAGTVGGYPRVAQVARADRHILGQLKAGAHVRLLFREPDEAVGELRAKLDYWREWLPDIAEVIV